MSTLLQEDSFGPFVIGVWNVGVWVDVQSPFSGFRGSLRIPGEAGPSGLERNAEQP